jgi:trehalose 6-phosphate phosphatase
MNAELQEAVEAAGRVLRERSSALISDIDGTLSPIVALPEEAVVLPECRRALAKLVGRLDLVAVISGRTVADARRMVGIDGLLYFGNHGLERWSAIEGYRNEAAEFVDEMRDFRLRLEEKLRGKPDIRIEDKQVALSLHYRGAPRPDEVRQSILGLLGRLLPPNRFAVVEGKMVIEVRPPLALEKGTVIERLAQERRLRGAIFLGDEVADIDAMKSLRRLRDSRLETLTVGVGGEEMPAALTEASDIVLSGPPIVATFLELLAKKLGND